MVAMLGILVCAAAVGHAGETNALRIATPKPGRSAEYGRDVLPILRANCLACHNTTTHKAGLVLETPATMRKGGDDGPAIVPKNGGGSLLLRVAAHQVEPFMPPADNKVNARNLTPEQLGLIQLWIDEGAEGTTTAAAPVDWHPVSERLHPMLALAVSPDGRWLANARANQICMYELPSRRLAAQLVDPRLARPPGDSGVAHYDLVQSLAFSPDGELLASAAYREVKLWRRPKDTRRFTLGGTASPEVMALAVSPDEHGLAVASPEGGIRICQAADGRLSLTLAGQRAVARCLSFSPDGHYLVAAAADQSLTVWTLPEGRVLATASTGASINALAWVLDGRALASGAADHSIVLWFPDAAKQELYELQKLHGHDGPVTSLATLEVTGTRLLSGSGDGTLRLWNLEDGQVQQVWHQGSPVFAVAVRPDGRRFASAGLNGLIKLWDLPKGKLLAELGSDRYALERVTQRERDAAFATNELAYQRSSLQGAEKDEHSAAERVKQATTAYADAQKAFSEKEKAWQAAKKTDNGAKREYEIAERKRANAQTELELAHQAATNAVQALAKARADLAAASRFEARATAQLQAAQQAAHTLGPPVRVLAFSPDSRFLASAGDDGVVRTWNADDGRSVETYQGHHGAVFSLGWTEKSLISGSADRAAIAWNLDPSWRLERTLGSGDADSPLVDRVNAVRFSPDGQWLATGGGVPSRSGELKLWRVADGQMVRDLPNVHSDAVLCLDFSPDGKFLISGAADRLAKVVELATGKVVKTLEGHTGHVLGVAWHRNGRTLLTAGADEVVKVWNFATGERQANVTGFNKEVTSVSFVGQGDLALATSGDNQVRLFQVDGKSVRTFGGIADFPYCSAATPDAQIILAGGQDGILHLWNVKTGQALASLGPPPR